MTNPFGISPDMSPPKDIFSKTKELFGIGTKQAHYQQVFMNPIGQKVLSDMASYAKLDSTIFDRDPVVMGRNEGRRQMLLYIMNILHLDVSALGENQ